MNRSLRMTLLLLAIALGCGSCEKKAVVAAGSPVLASAGSDVITVDDFQKEVERRIAKNLPIPDKQVVVDEMLGRLAAVSRAKATRLDADAETKREMENILIGKLRTQELETKLNAASVTDEELRKAFAEGPDKFSRPAKVRLAMLQLHGDGKMSDGKRAELRAQMETGLKKAAEQSATGGRGAAAGGFGAVAVECSDDQVSRYRGGDVGWLDSGNFSYRWPKDVLAAGYALEKGACSGIIEADNGFYVVMKTDSREGSTSSYDEAKASLSRDLLTKKRADIESQFLKENRTLTGAEIKSDVLATVSIPAGHASPAPLSDAPPSLPGMTAAPSPAN